MNVGKGEAVGPKKVLLDTHVLIWWILGDRRLSAKAKRLIANEEVKILVSAASAWEISTKVRSGKLAEMAELVAHLPTILTEQKFAHLDITMSSALTAGSFEVPHRDPFDRILSAQALEERVPIISNDETLELFGVARVW